MANLVNIRLEGNEVFSNGRLFDESLAKRFLRDAVDDIADAVEAQVQRTVPIGETGELKRHPIDRDDTRIGVVGTGPAFGGGTSIHGPGGRFIGASTAGLGELIARSTLTVPLKPKHAIWVHDGTGVYKPGGSGKPITTNPAGKFMKFTWQGKRFRVKSVKGQEAQPYLTDAFLLINRDYVPVRIAHLRAEVAAL